jgi:hypothetical protein
MTKICTKCDAEKPIAEFNKQKTMKDGYANQCRSCANDYCKKYYVDNSEELNEISAEWHRNNKEYHKSYRSIEKNRERQKEYLKVYSKWYNKQDKVKKYIKAYHKNRLKSNTLYRLSSSIRKRLSQIFISKGLTKNKKTQEILGCSFKDFKLYLESKFEPWMNWENRGLYNGELNYGWDIDHIVSISNAETQDDVIRLNHYTNLQPLCSRYNRNIKPFVKDENKSTQ